MSTAGDLITAAFNKVGVYTPTTAQTASALVSLNNMIGTWGVEGILTSVTRENFTLTIGDAEYTIGPSGDFNTVRPSRIENAFLRDSGGYDTPLDIIAGKDWNAVSSKTTEGQPSALYFIPEVTLAKIIFDCEPDYTYGFYIESTKPLTEFSTTATSLTLPNEYKEAIVYNLAVSLAEDWDRIVSKSVQNKADETRYLMSAVQASTRPVPKAKFDMLIGSAYNINTDQ